MLHLTTFTLLNVTASAVSNAAHRLAAIAISCRQTYAKWHNQFTASADHLHYIRQQARDEAVDLHHFWAGCFYRNKKTTLQSTFKPTCLMLNILDVLDA